MFTSSILALGLSLLTINVSALPATSAELNMRDTVGASTINAYIDAMVQAGFKPNGKVSKRSDMVEKRADPKVNVDLVLSVLAQHGFVAPKTTTTSAAATKATSAVHRRDDDEDSALTKRTLPDINQVITLLKAKGFYPSGKASRSLDLTKRQSSNEINTVVNQLQAAGYRPADFGPTAAAALSSLTLPVETTALCPKDNNTQYATGGISYAINCAWDYPGGDLWFSQAASLAACLSQCSAYKGTGGPCVGASWGAGNCWMKSKIDHNNHNPGMSAGRNLKITY